jgi:glycosyltransferase involved in cell wall biosynthesis
MRVTVLLERSEGRRFVPEVFPVVRERGVELLVGTVFGFGEVHEQLGSVGVASFSLGCRTSRDYPMAIRRLAMLGRAHRTELVHGIEVIPAFLAGAAGRLGRRTPSIFHRQHTVFDEQPGLTRLSAWASRLCTLTMACSGASAEAARQIDGVDEDRIRVVHNAATSPRPVDERELAAIRERLGISPDAAVISVVSRLRPEKGLDVLLDALPRIVEIVGRRVELVIAGDGGEEAALRRRAAKQSAAGVHFVGYQYDVAPWIAVGDVFAMPSRKEPFGIAATEAMSYGVAVVAGDVDGLREVIADDVDGLLVRPDDVEALAVAIGRLLIDPERRARIGSAGRATQQQRFTSEAWANAWVDVYEGLLGRS